MEGDKGDPDLAPELRVTETANRGTCPACPTLVAPVQKQPREWTAAAMQGWCDPRALYHLVHHSWRALGAASGPETCVT